MQPAVYALQLHPRQRRPQCGGKPLHAALVGKAHPGQMPGEIAPRHELAEGLLFKAAHRVGVHREIPAVPRQQWLGQHHAGDADARRKAFGEGGQIDHRPVRPRHALQAGQRAGVKAEFRVIIIL